MVISAIVWYSQYAAHAVDIEAESTGHLQGFATSRPFLHSGPELGEFPRIWQLGPRATMQLRGRLDTDSIWTSQSAANTATFGELGNVVGLRRAWIGVGGELGSASHYIADIDVASGRVVPRDVFLGIGDAEDSGESRFGHFLEPFSLELGTNSDFLAFMERSPISLLDPARNWGVGRFCAIGDSTLAAGVFHAGNDEGGLQGGDGGTVGFTGRFTTAPINDGDGERLLHLAIALSERIPESGVIIFNQQPANPLLDLGDSATSPFVPTLRIPATFQQLINLQLATVNGPFWTQAEWYGSLVDQKGAGDVFFHGSYVACGYFVTGQHRAYETTRGVMGPVPVDHPVLLGPSSRGRTWGLGTWELAVRFGYLDFFDSDTPVGESGQLVGISLPATTFGVNWYLTERVRLMFNYNYELPDEPNTGTSVANIFGTRLNVHW